MHNSSNDKHAIMLALIMHEYCKSEIFNAVNVSLTNRKKEFYELINQRLFQNVCTIK